MRTHATMLGLALILLIASYVESGVTKANADVSTSYSVLAGTNEEDHVIPHGLTGEEEFLMSLDPSLGRNQAYPWECNPDLYGFTSPPTGDYRFPSEYESTSGLLLGWPSWGCVLPELTEIVRKSVDRIPVSILVPTTFRQSAVACLKRRGLTDSQIAHIAWVETPVDSVWIRDYGPEVVSSYSGSRYLVDMSYYPQLSNTCNNLVGRPNDDAAPTHLADIWNLPFHRPRVRLEGGNLLSDGEGTCFRARRVANKRNCFSRWCYTEEELNEVLGSYYNCNVVVLDSMVGGVIDHIDMWMTILSPTTILVGRYDPAEDDPENAPILDRNAEQLTSLGYRVVRIPMPKPYCMQATATCVGKEHLIRMCNQHTTTRIWATYTNSIRVGNAMLVPVYHWVPEAIRADFEQQQKEALAIYQQELDREFGVGAVEVIPIQSDVIIPCQGSFHCVTMTYK